MGGEEGRRKLSWALWWGVLLAWGATGMSFATSGAFLPPGSTVVLLSGLPGDLESENAYREQLRTWLDIVQSGGRARQVLVLCDSPDTLGLPSAGQVKVMKGDRQSFLGLQQTIGGMTNPLVVIAWGHGGRQGEQPVLHVRGPRLMPADFADLAAKASAAESHWALLFRGSGVFARRLAAENRYILSSECDSSFTSDPVGMPLLMKLARAQPDLPLEKLAEEFGRATASWYSERNLARTEEPTFWKGAEKPQLLAKARVEEPKEGTSASAKEPKAAATNQVAEREPVPGELPAVWKGITRVKARNYPEDDGVLLRRKLSYTLGRNPAVGSEVEEFIQVLTPEGKRFGDFDISYSPPYEEISFLDCEVLRPDGKLVRMDPDAIGEATEKTLGDFQVGRRKVFSLPGVMPGAVLHVRYVTQWKNFPLPEFSMGIPISEEMPAVEAAVQVSVPKASAFHFAAEHVQAPDPVISQGSYGTSYSWQFRNLASRRQEALAPPRQRPQLLISTFADWRTFAEWYGRISRLTDEVTPEITAKAKELTQDRRTEREKVAVLYNYVASLRYVAVPVGVNSVRPHSADNVLRNQFGDCKDKANLLNALLHALGIEAHLVLVPRFGQAYAATPGLAFNHAISRVESGGEILWLDTTDDVCRFGMLPPGDAGRRVLVIDGKSDSLTQLPAPKAEEHRLEIRGEAACFAPSEAMPMKMKVSATGFPDYALRSSAREARNGGASLPLLAAAFRPNAGSFAMEQQSATPISALNEDFGWRAEGACVGLSAASGGQWLLHSPFWLPQEWDQALHRRKAPLFLNQGYPLTLDEEFVFALPAGVKPLTLPPASENNKPPLRWKIEWTSPAESKVRARFRAELEKGELAAEESQSLQKQLLELFSALGADVALNHGP